MPSPVFDFVRQVQEDRARTAARLGELDRLISNLRVLYPEAFEVSPASQPASDADRRIEERAQQADPNLMPLARAGVNGDVHSANRGAVRSPSPLVEAVRTLLTKEGGWLTTREVADLLRARGVGEDDEKLEQNVRAALTRRIPEIERKMLDGRTAAFRIPQNADSPTETVGRAAQS
ncbi:MAG: hypothetical protein ACXVXV_02510, partial [Blastococcus sp.]